MVLVAGLAVALILLFPGVLDLAIETQLDAWQALPFTSFSQLPTSGLVKINGTVAGPTGSTVLTGTWHATGKSGGYYVWTGPNFYLVQGPKQILVDISSLDNTVYGDMHQVSSTQQEVWAGDSLLVIGDIEGTPSAPEVGAQDLSPVSYTFVTWTDRAINEGLVIGGVASLGIAAFWADRTVRQRVDLIPAPFTVGNVQAP